ncbi:MAG: hypothetical protein HY744_10955 [Deltaproteobacteria bacterium]|nr:hypothetical protein [Deltaproteobacteria bacterium]
MLTNEPAAAAGKEQGKMVELLGSSRLTRAGALALLALAGGCGPVEDDEPEQLGGAAQPIYNAGDGLAADDNGAHPQAVWIVRSDNSRGSAFLVASNVVLTAAHATAVGEGIYTPYTPFQGKYNVKFLNVSDKTKALLTKTILPWTTSSAHVEAHPLFSNIGSASVDVAALVMPTSVSRCAMRPLRVVDELPDPPVVEYTKGTLSAWSGMLTQAVASGGTDAACLSGVDGAGIVTRTSALRCQHRTSAGVTPAGPS